MTKQIPMEVRNGVRAIFHSDSPIPTYGIGPALINGEYAQGEIPVAIASNETTLIPSIGRGLKVTRLAGGIETHVLKDEMTRAPLITAKSEKDADDIWSYLTRNKEEVERVVNATTGYGHFTSMDIHQEHMWLYVRLGMFCGDAAGHNMTTKAGDALISHLVDKFGDKIEYTASSSNYCTDKKPAEINKKKGRGKSVKAEILIPEAIVEARLHTTAEAIANLNGSKNWLGSGIAGSIGRNAHHANVVAAIYLATGQDIANVVEGSLGDTEAENRNGDLYFAVDMPAIIVGTVGGGTKQQYARRHLEAMGCFGPGDPSGSHAKKLAEIVAATTLAGELSLMAALTKQGEHMRAHNRFER